MKLNKILNYENRNLKSVIVILVFISYILFSIKGNNTEYYHDSYYYWHIADTVISSGQFNILDFPETFR